MPSAVEYPSFRSFPYFNAYGPFKRLDLDISDGNGRPRLGPHILAGVNGSGKSTVLRTIAWVLAQEGSGFDLEAWGHLTRGHRGRRALVVLRALCDEAEPYAVARGFPLK
jgi:ABC-type uncharacterized transport system ATPase component